MEPLGRILEYAQPFVLGDSRIDGAENAHRVPLLEAVQRARCRARFDVRESRYRHELAAGRLDLEVQQRTDGRPLGLPELGDDLVAAVEEVEAVDVAAAERCAELAPDTREIEPEIRHLIAIDH